VDKGFAHPFGMGGRSKQESIFWKLGFKLGDRSGTKARFHYTGALAFAGKMDAVQYKVILAAVLSLIFDRINVVQIETGKAGIHVIMAVIEFDRPKFISRGEDTIDLGDFGGFSRFRISAAQAADKAVSIGHVADELHGVFDSLTEGGHRRKDNKHEHTHPLSHKTGAGVEAPLSFLHLVLHKMFILRMTGGLTVLKPPQQFNPYVQAEEE
jgi:hypothetical protein